MKIVAKNRRARFDYDLLDTVEAGIMLTGQEVKSCRMGHVDLSGAYIIFENNVPTIRHLKIQPYRFASNLESYNPSRQRTLLLNKREQKKLQAYVDEKGVTIIPLEVTAGRHIKIKIAAARGRKTIDKRQHIKEKELKRRMRKGREE